jgi:hypothetical protein
MRSRRVVLKGMGSDWSATKAQGPEPGEAIDDKRFAGNLGPGPVAETRTKS